jgi:hypothetical protein
MRILPILLAACLPGLATCPIGLQAQDSGEPDNSIHAVTTLHEDGTKTETITDPDKHTTEATTYNAANKMIERIVYTLDDQNQAVTGVVYSAANKPVFKAEYKHDDSGRISEEDDYTMADQLIRRFVYEFGPNGKVIRIRGYDAQGNEMQESVAKKDERQSLPRTH